MQKRNAYGFDTDGIRQSEPEKIMEALQEKVNDEMPLSLVMHYLESDGYYWAMCVPGYTDADGRKHLLLPSREEAEDVLADYAACMGIHISEAVKRFSYDALYAGEVATLIEHCR